MLKRFALALTLAYASSLALTVAVVDRSLTSDRGFEKVDNPHGTGCPKGTRWNQSDKRCVKQK